MAAAKPAVAGHVVGVRVGLEDVADLDAEIAGQPQVLLDVELGIDDRRGTRVLVADQVRGAAEVVVGDLAQDHRPPTLPEAYGGAMTRSYASGVADKPLLGETIGENLERTVARFGDREALVVRHQDVRLTYAELDEQVDRARARR